MVEVFAEAGFTCYYFDMDASLFGSVKDLDRIWFIVLDIPKEVCEELGIENKIFELLNIMQDPDAYDVDEFLNPTRAS